MRILTISYCFPPVASPESFVTAKLMGALGETDVDVVSADPSLFPGPPDHSLDAYVADRFRRIERIGVSWPVRRLLRVPRLPLRPDRYVLLYRSALHQAMAMAPAGYDALVTRGQYHSAHLVGLALKRRFPRLPWIASFSDPWTGGVYETWVPVLSAYSARHERQVLARADAVILPSQEMLDHVADRNRDIDVRTRAMVIPHSFDPVLHPTTSQRLADQPRRICYFGSFYGPRSAEPLLVALDIVVEAATAPAFVVDIFGRNAEYLAAALVRHPRLEGLVRHRGELPHTHALAEMGTADILLMVDAPMPPPSIFMASKLVDYIGAGRPILAVAPDGAAASMVRELGGAVAPPDDPAGIARELSTLLSAPAAGGNFDDVRARFRVDRPGARLADAIDAAIDRCG